MKKHIPAILKRLTLTVLAVSLCIATGGQAAHAAVTNQSIAVPMYQYPTLGTFWDDITSKGGDSVPFVIMNPATGPGVSADPTYQAEIAENEADGIRTIGYINANYQNRPWQEAIDDINGWWDLYPNVTGLIIDLVEDDTPQDVCYVATLYNHIKNNRPNHLVVLNPGTHLSDDYEPYGDIFMNAENTWQQYRDNWHIQYPGWEDNPAYSNRFWHAIHTTSPADYDDALAKTRDMNAGWVFITDDVMPVPYQVTPTYWDTEVTDVDALPDSAFPNRGKTQLPSGCVDLSATTSDTTIEAFDESKKTTTKIQLANTSSLYPAEPSTSVQFTLPQGVQFAASGTNWDCSVSGVCNYSANIAASASAAVLTASFTAPCGYNGAAVQGTAVNYAGNTTPISIPLETTPNCTVISQLANAGLPTAIASIAGVVLAGVGIAVYIAKRPGRAPRQPRW